MSMQARGGPTTTSSAAWWLVCALAMLASVALAACATAPAVAPQTVTGRYVGKTEDGKPIAITFSESDRAFQAEGTIGDQPLVLAGAVGWRGVGSLVDAEGTQSLVEVELSADGEHLVLKTSGGAPMVLDRGDAAPPTAAEGPFSGTYRARKEGATIAEASLVQRGRLLTGVAMVAGDPSGVSGYTTGPNSMSGFVTFLDGSQVAFEAELAADQRSITLRGFGGRPTTLEKTSP